MRLTERQHRAVYERNKNILVSAAAGSGKTSVLSRRIVELVAEGADIRRMLICTYTNPAAGEMRDRIGKALLQRAEETGDVRLGRQAEYAQMADICTIHKFAIKVVRENFLQLGLPESLRVGGDDETGILLEQAMEEVFEALYEEEDAGFLSLRDRYAGRTDRPLKEIVAQLYSFVVSRPEGNGWLHSLAREDCAQKFRPLLIEMLEVKLSRLADLLADCCIPLAQWWDGGEEDPSLDAKMLTRYKKLQANNAADMALAADLKATLLAEGTEALAEKLAAAKIPNLPAGLEPEEMKNEISDLKKKARALIKELQPLCAFGPDALQNEAGYMQAQAADFARIIDRVEASYSGKKLERGLMDYDDMIRGAYKVLQDEEVAEVYRGRYDMVFVDEYQDTNPIQEAMLARVSRESNRFMVGDIKQSIYRFRLADPLIFLEKTRLFEGEQKCSSTVVRMNENFRSAPKVLETANLIMERLMSPALGEIEYDEGERLIPRGDFEGDVELMVTDGEEELADGEESSPNTQIEAHAAARKILSLIGTPITGGGVTRPAGYGDICILLRSTKGNAAVFGRVLSEYGIPVETPEGKYVSMSEVEVFADLLRLLDNGRQDLPLLSVMRSHIGGFDEAQLADIRSGSEEEAFCDCLQQAARGEGPLAEKCRAFLAELDALRRMESGMRLGDFLIALKNRTEYAAYMEVLPGGTEKAATFRAFFAQVLAWAGQMESLFELVTHLEQVKKQQGSYFEPAKAGSHEGCVQVMSIHKSKGLEFPIVLLCRLSGAFNKKDLARKLLIHPALGLVSNIWDEKTRTYENSLTRQLARYVLDKEMKSEELRILYVAMTRAKNKLILSGTVKKPMETFARLAGKRSWTALLEMDNMLSWILAAVLDLPGMGDWNPRAPMLGEGIPHTLLAADTHGPALQRGKEKKDTAAVLMEAGSLPYRPFLSYHVNELPVKIGVTAVVNAHAHAQEPEQTLQAGLPKEGMMDAARRGTLIHLLFQHLDLSGRTREDVEEQIALLLQKRLITKEEQSELKRFGEDFARFLQSDLAWRIRRAEQVYREVPFSLLADARELGISEVGGEDVVVQGIIDLLFKEEDGWVIVDYKSNRARREDMGRLAKQYKVQLRLYERAVREIMGEPVKAKYLYLLRMGEYLELMEG
ncbi:MAG: UvrD-helicase domain-containing protein [Christensenellaceae bacterium]|nr:UvrD-helicase domain-containing protein [Christensenellaceae bacterium]